MVIDQKDMEVWTNPGRGRVVVLKHDPMGRLRGEMVGPGRKVHLTALERQINQERAYSTEQDVFANGTLQPVRLLEGDESEALLASNPEWLGQSDMEGLISGHFKTLEKRVSEISNPATLQRLLEVAREKDASVKQVELIDARLSQVMPLDVEDVQVTARTDDLLQGGIKPVTPR